MTFRKRCLVWIVLRKELTALLRRIAELKGKSSDTLESSGLVFCVNQALQ